MMFPVKKQFGSVNAGDTSLVRASESNSASSLFCAATLVCAKGALLPEVGPEIVSEQNKMSLIRLRTPCKPVCFMYGRIGGGQRSRRSIIPPIQSADPKRQIKKAEQQLLFTLAVRSRPPPLRLPFPSATPIYFKAMVNLQGHTLYVVKRKEKILAQGLNQALEEMEGEHTEIESRSLPATIL